MSDLEISSIKKNNYLLNPRIDQFDMSKTRIKFGGSLLNQFPLSIIHGKIVNIYIIYEISDYINDSNYPTIENCLFWSVKLTKNADIDKYGYSRCGIGFDRKGFFSICNDIGRNVIIFGVDMSSSIKIDNRKKDIFIIGKGPTQWLENALSAEKLYSIILLKKYKILFKIWIIMEQIVIYLLTVHRLLNLKQRILKFKHIYYA